MHLCRVVGDDVWKIKITTPRVGVLNSVVSHSGCSMVIAMSSVSNTPPGHLQDTLPPRQEWTRRLHQRKAIAMFGCVGGYTYRNVEEGKATSVSCSPLYGQESRSTDNLGGDRFIFRGGKFKPPASRAIMSGKWKYLEHMYKQASLKILPFALCTLNTLALANVLLHCAEFSL